MLNHEVALEMQRSTLLFMTKISNSEYLMFHQLNIKNPQKNVYLDLHSCGIFRSSDW